MRERHLWLTKRYRTRYDVVPCECAWDRRERELLAELLPRRVRLVLRCFLQDRDSLARS